MGFVSGFHGKGEDFLAAVESLSSGKVGIYTQAKIDLAVWPDGKNTKNLCKGNILELVSEEKHTRFVVFSRESLKIVSFLTAFHQSQLLCKAS